MINKEQVRHLNARCSFQTPYLTLPFQNPSLVLKAVQQLEFEDRPVPDLLEPYDVSVRIEYTGICGSDVGSLLFLRLKKKNKKRQKEKWLRINCC